MYNTNRMTFIPTFPELKPKPYQIKQSNDVLDG